ncbi:hypothetical protein J7E62_21910 [Variovorax paradoxus]|nr:hypothetical protein [Variovorax paradoxus]
MKLLVPCSFIHVHTLGDEVLHFRVEGAKQKNEDSTRRAVRAQILAKASEALGTGKAATEWISSPAMRLDGARTIDLMALKRGRLSFRNF